MLIAIAGLASCSEPMPDKLELPSQPRYPYGSCALPWMSFEIAPTSRDHVVLTFDADRARTPRIGQRWSDFEEIRRVKRRTEVNDDGTFDADARRDVVTGRVVGARPPRRPDNARTLSPDRRHRLDGPHNNVVRAITVGSDREVFRAPVDPCVNVRSPDDFREVEVELEWLDDRTPVMVTNLESGHGPWPWRLDVWDLDTGRVVLSTGDVGHRWGPWLLEQYRGVVHMRTGATIATPDEILAVSTDGSWVAWYHRRQETLWFQSRDGRSWTVVIGSEYAPHVDLSPRGRFASWRAPDGLVFLDLERGLLHGSPSALDSIDRHPQARPPAPILTAARRR